MANYFATFVVLLIANEAIFPVKGQCTVQGCDNGDPLSSLVAEIQQLRVDLFDQLNKQVQSIHELHNASFQEIKNSVLTSLKAVDERLVQDHEIYIKQGQSIHELLNASYQERKSQHTTVNMSLQAVDRCPQEHDIYIKQFQSIHDILNQSFQEIKSHHDTVMKSHNDTVMRSQLDAIIINLHEVDRRRSQEHDIYIKQGQSIHELLNESFQEMKSQHDTVMTSLQALDRRLQEQDISMYFFDRASQVTDCSDIKASGKTASGVYVVCVGSQLNRTCTSAFCDMETASLVFQRRKDGSVNFNRTWAEYKQGFGDRNGEFWLGNDMLHLLTSKRNYKLRVDLEDFTGAKRYAEYARFSINSSDDNYRLTVSGYSGTAGDSLSNSNGRRFSTYDVDNDDHGGVHCALQYGGAWWHKDCSFATLNGKYYHRYDSVSRNKGIHWYYWHNGFHISLKATTMNLVPVA